MGAAWGLEELQVIVRTSWKLPVLQKDNMRKEENLPAGGSEKAGRLPCSLVSGNKAGDLLGSCTWAALSAVVLCGYLWLVGLHLSSRVLMVQPPPPTL